MSQTDYTVIDPVLLTPAQLVTRRMQLKAKENMPPARHEFETNSEELPSLEELSQGYSAPVASQLTFTTSASSHLGQRKLSDFADTLKRKLDLQPQDCAELDELIAATPEERALYQIALLLEIRRDQKKMSTLNGEKLADSLKTSARHYSLYILLSPSISSYTGKNFADIVVKCMRAAGIEGVPTDQQVVKLKALKQLIGQHATQDRFSLKNKVVSSLAEGSPHHNIAVLAQHIVGTHNIPITVDFLGRLAVIRWAVREYRDKPPNTFWPTLDTSIDAWRGEGGFKAWGNSVAMWSNIKFMYDEDVQEYGNLANSDVQITDIRNISSAQKSIDDWAKKIVPPQSASDQGKPEERTGGKRARTEEQDSNDPEEE